MPTKDKEPDCINSDGHRFATNKVNEDGTFELYCKECGITVTGSEAH